MLTSRTLTAEGANELMGSMRTADRLELHVMATAPGEAMTMMLLDAFSRGSIGEAWEVVDSYGHCVGAYGYHIAGCQIYSLWAPLNRAMSRQILKEMPQHVTHLVRRSRCETLSNMIWAGNKTVLRWLELSRCFKVHYTRPIKAQGREMIYFQTKPLRQLEAL